MTPKPNEIRIKDDLVLNTHGISVFTNPAKVPMRFDLYKVVWWPDSLKIQQRGDDPEH
jgi:hypothetical protein